jgi:hypothetical protein
MLRGVGTILESYTSSEPLTPLRLVIHPLLRILSNSGNDRKYYL